MRIITILIVIMVLAMIVPIAGSIVANLAAGGDAQNCIQLLEDKWGYWVLAGGGHFVPGDLLPSADNTWDIGSAGQSWADGWFDGTLYGNTANFTTGNFTTLNAPTGRTATRVVAASDSSTIEKAQADYVCDGTTDNVEIQAALNALSSGGEVVLLEGNYTTSATITLKSNIVLTISGTITLTNGVNNNMFQNADLVGGNTNITVRGTGILDGNAANQNNGEAIQFSKVTKFAISGLTFKSFYHHCIQIGGDTAATASVGGVIEKCTFDNAAGDDTITLFQGSSYVTVVNNIFKNQVGGGAEIGSSAFEPEDGAHDIIFANNHIYDYVWEGIYLHTHPPAPDTYNILIANNVIENCLYGIQIRDGYNITISNNIINRNTGFYGGVLISGGYDINIIGGSISYNSNNGLCIYRTGVPPPITPKRILISGVTLINNGQSGAGSYLNGIYIAEPYVTITNCIIADNQAVPKMSYGIYCEGATDGIVSNNQIYMQAGNWFKGIRLNTGTRFTIENNLIRGSGLASQWGISEEGASDYNNFYFNRITGCVAATVIVKVGANTKVKSNDNYVTENSGTATVLNTATSIVVNHGLATTPTRVFISLTNSPTNDPQVWWVDTLAATQFTIRTKVDPGATGAIFNWRAVIGEGN